MMFALILLGAWFSLFDFHFGNPLIIAAVLVVMVIIMIKLFNDAKKKDETAAAETEPATVNSGAAAGKPGDLTESLRSLANIVNFLGVSDGAVILNDLAAGDYSHAPRAARALATKLDTPDGRKELIRRVIEKHAHSFADDPQIVSRFASVMAKAKR